MTTTDEYLRKVTIGELTPLDGPVVLVPPHARWPSQYALLAGRVRRALGPRALLLEHVGSTSVPGLSAKPIVDMVLTFRSSADEAAYVVRQILRQP